MSYDQLAQSQEANTFEVEFEPRAYSKMILHAAKYPHCAVSGLLLASGGRKSTGQIVLTDCIPLFHQSEGELLSFIYFRDLLAKRSNFFPHSLYLSKFMYCRTYSHGRSRSCTSRSTLRKERSISHRRLLSCKPINERCNSGTMHQL